MLVVRMVRNDIGTVRGTTGLGRIDGGFTIWPADRRWLAAGAFGRRSHIFRGSHDTQHMQDTPDVCTSHWIQWDV
jgi:transposase